MLVFEFELLSMQDSLAFVMKEASFITSHPIQHVNFFHCTVFYLAMRLGPHGKE
ncbi:MAG: hypothetical protein IPG10_02090 [Flavobacteriales bacterium]|nr:hypothetical protein [Flavobacteriales bacterium]